MLSRRSALWQALLLPLLLTAAWVLLGPLREVLEQTKPAVLIGWLNSDSREISRRSCIFSGHTQDARAVIKAQGMESAGP